MRPKTIATGLLLAFVVLSIGVLVGKELRPGATRPEGVAPPAPRIAQAKAIPAPRVIAYYFHGTTRCVTCNSTLAEVCSGGPTRAGGSRLVPESRFGQVPGPIRRIPEGLTMGAEG